MASFLSREVQKQKQPSPVLNKTSQHCIGINGLSLDVDGIVQANLTFPDDGELFYKGNFLISNKLFSPLPCIIGWDFLTSNGLALSREYTGAYVLVGQHGRTPLTPRNRDFVCPSRASVSIGPGETTELDNHNVSGIFSQCTSKGLFT